MNRVSVVIVAYGSSKAVAELVPQLLVHSEIADVVVVDHGSDGSANLARQLGAKAVEDPSNPGFGAGQNRGVALTESEFVLLMNPDVDPRLDPVLEAIGFMETRPHAGMVQGVVVNAATREPERSSGEAMRSVHLWARLLGLRWFLRFPLVRRLVALTAVADHAVRTHPEPVRVQSLAATMVLVRRSAFDSVGGFDESYFLYGEDIDLCLRLAAHGWELWTMPETWAVHESGGSSSDRWTRELAWWEGTLAFGATWWGAVDWTAGLLAALVRAVLLSITRPSCGGQAFRRLVVAPVRRRSQVMSSIR